MAITQYNPQTATLNDDEIADLVQKIVASLNVNARDFEHAKKEYNSDFFRDEPLEFRQALCRALHTHFLSVGTNQFWKKFSE